MKHFSLKKKNSFIRPQGLLFGKKLIAAEVTFNNKSQAKQ